MKNNRLSRLICAVVLAHSFLALRVQAGETNTLPMDGQPDSVRLAWFTDLPMAQARAKMEGKSVLLFFHGSDWCPPCVEMQRQVFASPDFVAYARQALVLVDVDFPEKQPQDQDLRRSNLALKARFNLSRESGEGFPTIVLLNEAGETVFQETGYSGGGAAEVLPKLQRHAGIESATANSTGFKNLTIDEFAKMAIDRQNVILDVRTAKEFEAGRLAGAVNLN